MPGRPAGERGGCPRCSGPVVRERDRFGPFLSCLACGWLDDRAVDLGDDDLQALVAQDVWERVMALLAAMDGGGEAGGGR